MTTHYRVFFGKGGNFPLLPNFERLATEGDKVRGDCRKASSMGLEFRVIRVNQDGSRVTLTREAVQSL